MIVVYWLLGFLSGWIIMGAILVWLFLRGSS